MKKSFILALICCSVLALPMLASMQKKIDIENKKSGVDWSKTIKAKNVKIVKKVSISDVSKEMKGKSPASRADKKKKPVVEKAATGDLGSLATGNKYAVVIGVCDYPGNTSADLCWADGDSLNMFEALTTLYGYTSENIYLLRDTNPNRLDITDGPATFNGIEDAVSEIGTKVKSGDEIVFFFSGHGGWVRDDEGNPMDQYPVDEIDDMDEAIIVHNGSEMVGISDDMLQNWFSGFAATRIVFIFDTCLAGGMNDLADEESSDNGRVVVMATEEDKSAYVYSRGIEGIEEGEGVFSRYFVNEGMLQGLTDEYDHDGNISIQDVVIEEAFDYAKTSIPLKIPFLKRRQIPVINDKFENDLLL